MGWNKIYWEDLYPDNTSVTDIKPTSNYIKDDQIGSVYKDKWVALESLVRVNDKVHAFTSYMGLPLKDGNNTKIINPIDGNFLQSNDARIKILNDIKYQLDKLKALPSQWKFDRHSETQEHKVILKHKFDEDIHSFTEEVYPFNIEGKIYLLDDNVTYVKASSGGTEYTDSWTDKKEDEFLKLNNPQEEIITRFVRDDENNTIVDATTYLMWEDTYIPLKRWTDADEYCKDLTLASYEDWRLPTFNDLKSIINPDGVDNVYDEFTKLASNPNGYWSSNTMIGFDYNFNRVTKAFVLSYHNMNISSWAVNNYSMNVMCVNQL